MSLFGDLPPPSSHLRPKQANLEEEYKPASAPDGKSGGEEHADHSEDGERHDRPEKRQRVEARSSGLSDEQISAALAKITSHISNPDKFSKAAGLLRQLLDSGALTRTHRDQLFKAVKAAFTDFDNASEASLRRDYMKLCHSLDKAAEQHQQHQQQQAQWQEQWGQQQWQGQYGWPGQPQQAQPLFSRAQRAQLDVYRLVGFTQNEMHTDDSFVFNKVLGRIKEAVAALPPATEEDEEALAELQEAAEGGGSSSSEEDDEGRGGARDEAGEGEEEEAAAARQAEEGGGAAGGSSSGRAAQVEERAEELREAEAAGPAAGQQGQGLGEAGEGAEAAAAEDEDDPFGLNQLLPAPERPPPPPPPPPPPTRQPQQPAGGSGGGNGGGRRGSKAKPSAAWSPAQALVMRRQALIECLITARGFHKTPWARTSVELLVEHFARHVDRFAEAQRGAVEEMVRFVRAARQARPSGPSQKEINRDSTSFERARSEWSKVHVSARGKVGSSGDAKANNWLG